MSLEVASYPQEPRGMHSFSSKLNSLDSGAINDYDWVGGTQANFGVALATAVFNYVSDDPRSF